MPNNGLNDNNSVDNRNNNDMPSRTAQNRSDDISNARTEDLVAIFGANAHQNITHAAAKNTNAKIDNRSIKKTYDYNLESFDDTVTSSTRHDKRIGKNGTNRVNNQPNKNLPKEKTYNRNSKINNDKISVHEHHQNGNKKVHDKQPNKKHEKVSKLRIPVRTVAIACLSIVAIGGIGYAIWNMTPLHSMIDGSDAQQSAADNSSSIDAEAQGRTVNSEKLDFTFEHKGIKYTFTDLTSVAPSESKSANGRETFKVTLKAVNETDEDYPMTSIGVNVFDPNGNYLADMVRNDTVLENGVDSIEDPTIAAGDTYERTLEIPATKSGTYTLEIIDVGTDEIFRVPVDIEVND